MTGRHDGTQERLIIAAENYANIEESEQLLEKSAEDREIDLIWAETDSDSDSVPQVDQIYKKSTILTQGTIYFILIVVVSIFLYFINYYNAKQLARLKEEYGFDVKKPADDIWWNRAVVYHILPQSFQDSDGDGIGDIKGIADRLNYLQYLEVDAILLAALFKSPMADCGRDVSDLLAVDPVYGTLQDFRDLVKLFQKEEIKVLLEFIPNHTSNRHRWFHESRKGGATNQYRDYYVWHPGISHENGSRTPPNNWLSRYGGSAWTWDDMRGEFYFHQWASQLPDLNHRSPAIRQEMLDVFRFWLDTGIDGLVVDGVHILLENEEVLIDEPRSGFAKAPKWHHAFLEHMYTEDNHDIHEFMATWREFVDGYSLQNQRKIFLGVDVHDDSLSDVVRYYFTGADAPLNYLLTDMKAGCGGRCVQELVDSWISDAPEGRPSVWVVGSPTSQRLAAKGGVYSSAVMMLALTLPGAVLTYYGEEIGMAAGQVSFQDTRDMYGKKMGQNMYSHFSRDPARTPMQWDSGPNAGFSSADKTWLPVNADFTSRNVEAQAKDDHSPMLTFRSLVRLRKEASFSKGKFRFSLCDEEVFAFIRYFRDHPPYLVSLNFGQKPSAQDYTGTVGMDSGEVVVTTVTGDSSQYKSGEDLDLSNLTLRPGQGIVVKLI